LSYSGKGKLQKVARAMGILSGFRGVNKLNQFLAASTSEVAIRSMHAKAKDNIRLQHKLELLDIDYKVPLTEPKLQEAMRQFAIDSQLQKNVLRDVNWMNDPRTRPFMLFKSFGLRQYQFIKDTMKFEVTHGNFMPIIRLATLGYFGGAFVDRSRHWLKELMAGEDLYREEKEGIDDFIENVAQVGAFGMLTDILAGESTFKSVLFAATPVMISDIQTMFTALTKIEADASEYGIGGALRRSPKGFAPLLGAAGRATAKFIEPRGQKERGIESYRRIVLGKIKKAMSEGKYGVAINNVHAWNRANPMQSITFEDISPAKIYDYIGNKYEKKLNP